MFYVEIKPEWWRMGLEYFIWTSICPLSQNDSIYWTSMAIFSQYNSIYWTSMAIISHSTSHDWTSMTIGGGIHVILGILAIHVIHVIHVIQMTAATPVSQELSPFAWGQSITPRNQISHARNPSLQRNALNAGVDCSS